MVALAAMCLVVCAGAEAQPGVAEVRALIDTGRYAAADARSAALLSASAGDAEAARLDIRRVRVEALLANGRGTEPEALTIARTLRHEGSADATAGTNARLLGLVLLERGDYGPAVGALREALRLDEATRGRESPDVATDLEALARAWFAMEDYTSAATALDRAVAMREERASIDGAGLARTLAQRALLWQRQAEYPKSRADLVRARALRESIDATHPETARVLTLFGDQLKAEAEYAQAIEVLEAAVAMAEATLRDAHPDIAAALRMLAEPLDQVGDIGRAKALRERAVSIVERAYGPNHSALALQLSDVAISHAKLGDYAEARRLLRRALSIYERRGATSSAFYATALYNLANRHSDVGDMDEAVREYRRVLAIWERTMGPRHSSLAFALTAIASSLTTMRRHREAMPYFERALAIREERLGRDHPRVARVLTDLATNALDLGDTARADELSRRAMDIWLRSKEREGLSEALLVRGRLATRRGEFGLAAAAFDDVLAIRIPLFGESHPSIAEAKAGLAYAMARLGRNDDAVATALEAERIGLAHLRSSLESLSERQALRYAETRPRGLDLALSVVAAGPPDPTRVALVLDGVIRARALVLDEMAARRRMRAEGGTAMAPLFAELTRTARALTNLVVRGRGSLTAERHAYLVEAARRDKEAAEAAVAERSSSYEHRLRRRDTGLDAVRRALPDGVALLSFIRYEQQAVPDDAPAPRSAAYAAFVVRPDRPEAVFVPLGDARGIDLAIERWRRTLLDGVTGDGVPTAANERALQRLGTDLRARLWDQVATTLTGVGRVLTVPDGALNLLPLAALPVGANQYLADSGPTIHYLSAERDVTDLDAAGVGSGLLAMGGPRYGAVRLPGRPADGPARRSSCGTFDSIEFLPLPASRQEARDVAGIWNGLSHGGADGLSNLLTGDSATEAAFKQGGPGRRILHVATHGFFLGDTCDDARYGGRVRGISKLNRARPRPSGASAPTLASAGRASPGRRRRLLPDNPLLRSGLALAGANQRSSARASEEDGILTADEVAGLDLDGVEWAVLSACDTGIGEIKVGEGVFGLRRAFRVAGARTTIMSLWPVEDRAARAWMRPLYEGRLKDKLSTAEAVRHASLVVLRERRAKGLSTHPFYWAGFVAAGDWR
jgi:CHAT domain-containing protein/tetratricopeptide (TPR) repeat protein